MSETAANDVAAARQTLEAARSDIRSRLGLLASWRAFAQLMEREAKNEPVTAVDGAALRASLEMAIRRETPLFEIAQRLDALIASLGEPIQVREPSSPVSQAIVSGPNPSAARAPVVDNPAERPRIKVRAGSFVVPDIAPTAPAGPEVARAATPAVAAADLTPVALATSDAVDPQPTPPPAARATRPEPSPVPPPGPIAAATAVSAQAPQQRRVPANIATAAQAIARAASALVPAKPQASKQLPLSEVPAAPKPTPAPAANARPSRPDDPLADWPAWIDPLPSQPIKAKPVVPDQNASLTTNDRLSAMEAELDRLVEAAAPPARAKPALASSASAEVREPLGLDGLTGEDLHRDFDGREAEIEIVPAPPASGSRPADEPTRRRTGSIGPSLVARSAMMDRATDPDAYAPTRDDVEEASVEIIVTTTPGAPPARSGQPKSNGPLDLQRAPRQRFLKALTGE